jgi:hypothetical protein
VQAAVCGRSFILSFHKNTLHHKYLGDNTCKNVFRGFLCSGGIWRTGHLKLHTKQILTKKYKCVCIYNLFKLFVTKGITMQKDQMLKAETYV